MNVDVDKKTLEVDVARAVDLTREVFALGDVELTAEPLPKGGSDRMYLRISWAEPIFLPHSRIANTVIFSHYGTERPDNAAAAQAARVLRLLGVPAPRLLAEDERLRLLWVEDVGRRDLCDAWASASEAQLRSWYQQAIDAAKKIHAVAEADWPDVVGNYELQPAFDAELYRWEQGYFAEHALVGVGGVEKKLADEIFADSEMIELAQWCAALPRHLIHRDFQSENIMLRDEQIALIDFQGMRMGLPEYDLASLLYDPYVPMGSELRAELLAYAGVQSGSAGERVFHAAAAQRLMQALGAFGLLGLQRGKPAYLAHVPVAAQRLGEVLDESGWLPKLRDRWQRDGFFEKNSSV